MSPVTHSPTSRHGGVVGAVVVGIVAVALVVGAMDTAIGWLFPLTVVGGGALAAGLVVLRPRQPRPDFSLSGIAVAGDRAEVMNLARVRVAGFGGAGLLLVAGMVALQFQLTSFALAAGALGGVIGALTVIRYRRSHASVRHFPKVV